MLHHINYVVRVIVHGDTSVRQKASHWLTKKYLHSLAKEAAKANRSTMRSHMSAPWYGNFPGNLGSQGYFDWLSTQPTYLAWLEAEYEHLYED